MPSTLLSLWLIASPSLAGSTTPSEAEASAPSSHLPEPLRDDLVLGVHPHRGALAAKALWIVPITPELPTLHATSLEAAILNGLAVKAEVSVQGLTLHGVQGGVQATLPSSFRRPGGHGLQALVEGGLNHRFVQSTLSWIVEAEVAPGWAVLGRAGLRACWAQERHDDPLLCPHGSVSVDMLADLDLFWHADPHVDVGLETAIVHRWSDWTGGFLLPQVHLHLVPHLDLQVGAGPAWEQGRYATEIATRIAVTY